MLYDTSSRVVVGCWIQKGANNKKLKANVGSRKFLAPYFSLATTNMEQLASPENSAHLQPISEAIIRYSMGQTSFEEYNTELEAWWETHKEAWREGDLSLLFRLVCLSSI